MRAKREEMRNLLILFRVLSEPHTLERRASSLCSRPFEKVFMLTVSFGGLPDE